MRNETFWDDRYRTLPWLGSGPGSRGIAQAFKARLLKSVVELNSNAVSSIVDVGCGDLCWLRTDVLSPGDLGNVRYCGLDISSVVVDANRRRFPGLDFRRYDLVEEPLPSGFDLVLCFDVLIHQTTGERFARALRNLLAGVGRHGLVSYANPDRPDAEVLPALRTFDPGVEAEFQRARREAWTNARLPTAGIADHGPLPDRIEHVSASHRVRHVADYRHQSVYELWSADPLSLDPAWLD